MMMYSADKEKKNVPEGNITEISKGIFIMGVENDTYFIQFGNVVSNYNANIIKTRIDYLNTLDKKELRKYHMEYMKAGDNNPESKGVGLGLIVIARRSDGRIEYEFEKLDDERQYFNMFLTIKQGG
jgi:hypothetical protein